MAPGKVVLTPEELLYVALRPRLARIGLAAGLGGEDIDEVVQTTFERYLRLPQAKRPKDPPTWLLQVARNAAVDLRRRRRIRAASSLGPEVASDQPTAQQVVLRREQQRALGRALDTLSTTQREILDGCVVRKESVDEVAARLGMKPQAVERARTRALTKICGRLRDRFTTIFMLGRRRRSR